MVAKQRVLLCGFGNMGQKHFKTLQGHADLTVVAVVDPAVRASHPLLAERPCFARLEDVPMESFDWAVVANPTEVHYVSVQSLLNAGKSVLVEKPAATSRQEAQALVDLASKKGLALAVGNIERCNPVTGALRGILACDLLGPLAHVATLRAGAYPGAVKTGNNVCLDLAVHDLDAVRSLVGPLTVVAAVGQDIVQPQIVDCISILLRGQDGMSAHVHVDWLSPERQRSLRLVGHKATCAVDYLSQTCRVRGENLAVRLPEAWRAYPVTALNDRCQEISIPVTPRDALSTQLEAWLQMLAGTPATILATGPELVDSVALAEAALAAAAVR